MPQNLSLYLIALTTTLILLCYVIPSTMSQQCSYLQGIDIFGNDLLLQFANTIDQCCNACLNNVNCQAWTYVPDTQACWIKSAIGSVRQAVSQSNYSLFYYFTVMPRFCFHPNPLEPPPLLPIPSSLSQVDFIIVS